MRQISRDGFVKIGMRGCEDRADPDDKNYEEGADRAEN
jgi:hypothetical protein